MDGRAGDVQRRVDENRGVRLCGEREIDAPLSMAKRVEGGLSEVKKDVGEYQAGLTVSCPASAFG